MKTNLAAAMTALKNKIQPSMIQQANKTSNPNISNYPVGSWDWRNQLRQLNMQKIQDDIKATRKSLGWTQRDLARASGMSQGTITRAERHGWISLSCLLHIASALGRQLNIDNLINK